MFKFVPIQSLKNEKIKNFIKLSKFKKSRNLSNSLTLEGFKLILDAAKNGAVFNQIFLTNKALFKINSFGFNLKNFRNFTIISENVAKKISMVENNQGLFAIVKKPLQIDLLKLPNKVNVLMLFEINDPGNLGTLIRSAAAFNFKTILLVNCCDVYSAKVIRSTMSTIFSVNLKELNFSQALQWLKNTTLNTYAAVLSKKATNVLSLKFKLGTVLCLGNEAHGLNEQIIKICKKSVKIAMANSVESLNVAVAGSVLMFNISNSVNFEN